MLKRRYAGALWYFLLVSSAASLLLVYFDMHIFTAKIDQQSNRCQNMETGSRNERNCKQVITKYAIMNVELFAKIHQNEFCISGYISGLAPVCGADGCLPLLKYGSPQMKIPRVNPPSTRINIIEKINRIDGWLHTGFHSPFVAALTDMQWIHGIYGSVGEIGVYMGKYTSALALNTDTESGERLFAADLFDMKTKVSKERGNLGMFLKVMKTWDFSPDANTTKRRLFIWHGSSVFLSKALLIWWGLPAVRFLSIDGGHIDSLVTSDYIKAACIMRRGGIIAFDDAMTWRQVQKGIQDFSSLFGNVFEPLVYCHNKLFVCTKDFYSIYMEYIQQNVAERFSLEERVYPKWHPEQHLYFECKTKKTS